MTEHLMTEQLTREEILERYKNDGYVVVPNALSPEEVSDLNALVNRDIVENPQDWHEHRQGAAGNGQVLMRYPELDRFVRHRQLFSIIQEILQNEACFAQLDFRDVPPELTEESGMSFHRDISYYGTVGGKTWDPDNPYISTYLCAIYYFKDVHDCCPAFCMVPNSHEYSSLDDAKAHLGTNYREVPIRGKAGTAVLYNITTYHTRVPGTAECPHGRRTMHNYHSRLSNPPLTNWATVPEVLAMSTDPDTRRFYSQWTPGQIKYARDHYRQPVPSYYPVTAFKNQ